MILSEHTKKVLKNFASINPSLAFFKNDEGPVILRTKDSTGSIIAFATIDEKLDRDFALVDVQMFNTLVNKMAGCELEFNDRFMTLSDGTSSAKLIYAETSSIVHPSPDKPLPTVQPDFSFSLPQATLTKVLEFADVLSLPNIRACVVDGLPVLQAFDKTGGNENKYQLAIADAQGFTPACSLIFKRELFKMIPGDYSVSISKQLISQFTNKTEINPITYIVGLEKSSTQG